MIQRKYRPIFNEFEWIALNESGGGLPILYISIHNCTAHLIFKGEEITKYFPKFSDWIEKSDIGITQSGIYPPLNIIAEALNEKISKGELSEPKCQEKTYRIIHKCRLKNLY